MGESTHVPNSILGVRLMFPRELHRLGNLYSHVQQFKLTAQLHATQQPQTVQVHLGATVTTQTLHYILYMKYLQDLCYLT